MIVVLVVVIFILAIVNHKFLHLLLFGLQGLKVMRYQLVQKLRKLKMTE